MNQLLRSTLLFIFTLGIGNLTHAVVVDDTTENTTAPADDPGFSNVAQVKAATGVYLGNRWMLTAAHVDAGTVNFPSIGTFSPEPDSLIQLSNPDYDIDLTPQTDLILFRLTEDPNLPSLRIGQETPAIGTEVLFVGGGRDRVEEPSYWDVETSGPQWTWTESEPPGNYAGFRTNTSTSIRWGSNVVENEEPFFFEFDSNHTVPVLTTAGGAMLDTITVVTEFDDPDGTRGIQAIDHESQAVSNDSGGGMFTKVNDEWYLSGLIVAIFGHPDQPDVTTHAIYGDLTLAADLSAYREQIEAVYLKGDFDGDLDLTTNDIDLLTQAILDEEPAEDWDLDGNGLLNEDDRTEWITNVMGTVFGDSNLDRRFSSSDLITVFQANHYEDGIPANSNWESGDWNGDLEFDSDDLILAFTSSVYEQPIDRASPSAQSVPEPNGMVAMAIIVTGIQILRRRQTATR